MARYRKIDIRIWNDEKFKRLSPIPPCGQGLWLYILTNPETNNIPGLFRSGEAAMAEALGWDLKAFREAFQEAFLEGLVKADWKARVVWVPNAIKYAPPESPNVVKSWAVCWDEIPECDLKKEAAHRIKAFLEGFDKAFQEALLEGLPEEYAESRTRARTRARGEEEKTTHSRTPSGAAVDVASPPKDKKAPETATAGNETVPFWQDTLDHFKRAWQEFKFKKTGRRPTLYIQPKWLPALKSLMVIYPAPKTMALWDVYLGSPHKIAVDSGYNFPQFLALINKLVDDDRYESLARQYQDALNRIDIPAPHLQVLSS